MSKLALYLGLGDQKPNFEIEGELSTLSEDCFFVTSDFGMHKIVISNPEISSIMLILAKLEKGTPVTVSGRMEANDLCLETLLVHKWERG